MLHFDFEVCFGNVGLDVDRSTAIFRIFQETLTNILRHAKAKNINVRMQEENDMVTVKIKDDGIGITPNQVSDSKSLGLLGMRERARAWNGDVEIQGKQDQGTTVTINIQRN